MYTVSKKTDHFSFEHNFGKFCPILIILLLLQTEIICRQNTNWISHFTYSLLLHYLAKMQSQKLLNKSAMHVVISLLLQSRKFWWYLLLTSLMLLHDVAMTSCCCEWYAECLVTTLCSSRTVQRHTAPWTCNSWTAASRNAKLLCAQPVASKQFRSQSCGLRDLGCYAASCLPQTNPKCGWIEMAAQRCLMQSWTIDFSQGYWPVRRKISMLKDIHAKGGHFEYSLWTDSVDFVHICYIQCDLFDFYVFNYEIMPATLLFVWQGSTLADCRCDGRFYGTLCHS